MKIGFYTNYIKSINNDQKTRRSSCYRGLSFLRLGDLPHVLVEVFDRKFTEGASVDEMCLASFGADFFGVNGNRQRPLNQHLGWYFFMVSTILSQIFLNFTSIPGGNDPIWRADFSDGLVSTTNHKMSFIGCLCIAYRPPCRSIKNDIFVWWWKFREDIQFEICFKLTLLDREYFKIIINPIIQYQILNLQLYSLKRCLLLHPNYAMYVILRGRVYRC